MLARYGGNMWQFIDRATHGWITCQHRLKQSTVPAPHVDDPTDPFERIIRSHRLVDSQGEALHGLIKEARTIWMSRPKTPDIRPEFALEHILAGADRVVQGPPWPVSILTECEARPRSQRTGSVRLQRGAKRRQCIAPIGGFARDTYCGEGT